MSNTADASRTRAQLRRLALSSAMTLAMFFAAESAAAANRILTIYFCGTSATSEWNHPNVSGWHTAELIASLYANDPSQEITKTIHYDWRGSNVVDSVDSLPGKLHYRYIVEGFGTPFNPGEIADPNNGPRTWAVVMGEAFKAINKVLELNPGDTVSLNLVGWSRGGIMTLKTARGVVNDANLNPKVTGMNILAFDPVPGCQDPIGAFGDDLKLPAKVNQFVGLYAYHEMSHLFEPVIPSHESSSTKVWIVGIPGGHETMMGNPQSDGHNLTGEVIIPDYSNDPAMGKIAEVTWAMAERLLNSPAWGSVNIAPLSAASDEASFTTRVNQIWDHDFTLIMNTTFIPLSWSYLVSCHDSDVNIRALDWSLTRPYDARMCFVSPYRHEPHLAWVWPCDLILPIHWFGPDRVFSLRWEVPRINANAWGTLQSLGTSVPPGMDTTPPEPITDPLPDAVGECSVTVVAPQATDVSPLRVTGTTPSPLTYSQQGEYEIPWTYTDAAGNSTTQKQKVIVKDTMAPMITAPAAVTATTGTAASCGVVIVDASLGTATAKDDCSGTVAVTRSGVPLGNLFPVGVTTVTYTASDAAGNTATAEQTVTVTDDTPPALVVPSALLVPTDAGACSAVVNFDITAADNCGVTVVSSPSSGSTFLKGTTTVTVTAADAAGNATTKTFDVTVADQEAPKITNASATPALLWPPSHQLVDVAVAYQALDNCDQAVCILSVSSNEPVNGTADGDTSPDWEIIGPYHVHLRAERAATSSGRVYSITIACRDGSGNASSRTVPVSVPRDRK